jgi:hypothetical protein
MDTTFDFVQLIKLVQQECGVGNTRVRPPRLATSGTELDQALGVIRHALGHREGVPGKRSTAISG